jgi:hypothetical protein
VTLTLGSALETTDVIRVNSGVIATAAGLTVSQTDYTVVADAVKPTCTVYAATGTATITITCDENIQVADGGTLNTLVDGIKVGGVALTADGAIAGKVLTVTEGQNWSSTGAAIVIPKDIVEDLAGNNNAAMSGSVITDTTKPTVIGLPTYTLAGLASAELEVGGTHTVKTLVGLGTQASVTHTDGTTGAAITIKTKPNLATTGTNFLIVVGDNSGATGCSVNTATTPDTYTVVYLQGASANTAVTALNADTDCNGVLVFTASASGGNNITNNDAGTENIASAAMTGGVDTNLVLTAVEANVFQNVQTVAVTASGGAETCTGTDTAISIGLDTAGTQTVTEAITAFNADADCNRYFTMSSADTGTEQLDQNQGAAASQTTTGTNDAITLRSKTAGIGGNAYSIQVADNNAALAISYTAGTKVILISHDVNSSAVAAATPAAIKAAMDAHATVKTLVDVTVTNNAVTLPVQAATLLAGGTTRLTVTTTFSEAVTVGGVVDVEYDVAGDNTGQVDAASNTVSGSTLTSTWTLTGATHLTAPTGNVDTIHYDLAADGGINDLASNVMVAAEKALAAP